MSEVQSTVRPGGTQPVRAAIARAATATGVDFDFLLAQARIESSLDPSARAGTSSAAGLYQFTGGTWLQTLRRHGAEHGLDTSMLSDPAKRAQVMALRFDPDAAALMAGELANDNRAMLTGVLGREPGPDELYLAHFMGAQGAAKMLTADPATSAAALFPAPAAANRTIFYAADGSARTVGEVLGVIRSKVERAMGASGSPSPVESGGWAVQTPSAPTSTAGPIGQAFQTAAAQHQAAGPSMAATLHDAFALGSHSAAPGFVRAAYGKLQGLGL